MSELGTFLSGAYYAVGITAICVGLVVWLANLQSTVKATAEKTDAAKKEIEARTEEREVALKEKHRAMEGEFAVQLLRIEKVAALETNRLSMRLEDMEKNGTRALSERVSVLLQQTTWQNERFLAFEKLMVSLQADIRELDKGYTALLAGLNEGNRRLNNLERREQHQQHQRSSTPAPSYDRNRNNDDD